MRKSKFQPQHITKILKEINNGNSIDQINCEYGVNSTTKQQKNYT
jgi:hypothetical protein